MPLTPALVRWRLVAQATKIVPWQPVADLRNSLPANSLYNTV